MCSSEYFWILKDKILEFGQANYDLKDTEVITCDLPFGFSNSAIDRRKSECYDLLSDIFKRLDQIQKEYTDMLYELSDEVPDTDSYFDNDVSVSNNYK